MNNIEKIYATKYLLQCLGKWYSEKSSNPNDLSILKSLKLIFLTCSISTQEEPNLLDEGFSFYAMPLGHVETDVYSFYKNGSFNKILDNKQLNLDKLEDEDFSKISSTIKKLIDKSISNLKKKNELLILESASSLVELSHKHSSWINNFKRAQNMGKLSQSISSEDIVKEEKFYFV